MFTKYITAIQAGFKAATVDFKCAVTDAKVDVALDQDVCVAPTLSRTYKVTYTVAKYVLKAWNCLKKAHTSFQDYARTNTTITAIVAPAAIVAVGLAVGYVATGAALVAAVITEVVATLYVAATVANAFIAPVIAGTSPMMKNVVAFVAGFTSVVVVCAYKALLIMAFIALI